MQPISCGNRFCLYDPHAGVSNIVVSGLENRGTGCQKSNGEVSKHWDGGLKITARGCQKSVQGVWKIPATGVENPGRR